MYWCFKTLSSSNVVCDLYDFPDLSTEDERATDVFGSLAPAKDGIKDLPVMTSVGGRGVGGG